jgi:hypothetical protein
MDVREETLGETRRHQRNKEPRLIGSGTSGEQEDIQQDHQEGSHAGDREAKSQTTSQDFENDCEDMVEGSAPSERNEETAHREEPEM